MEEFGFDKLPEVVRLLFEKVERVEALLDKTKPQKTNRISHFRLRKRPMVLKVINSITITVNRNIPVPTDVR